jgi:carboxypeptidase C (cathepsin A)
MPTTALAVLTSCAHGGHGHSAQAHAHHGGHAAAAHHGVPSHGGAALSSEGTRGEAKATEDEPIDEAAKEREVVRERTIVVDGKRVAYRSRTGTLVLRDAKGKAQASVFYVAYERTDAPKGEVRPITFAFNGGPGSSAVWLQLGTFGPRRVSFPDATTPAPPPYDLVDNDASILDVTDLVFIDPPGTGFSRAVAGVEGKAFWGVEEDAKIVAEFIRLFVARTERWNAPKFLAGESYGTTRAARLAALLHDDGIFLNGVILVSSILEFQTARFETGNDLPYVLFLPTYAATAWYHGRVAAKDRPLAEFLADVRTFAGGEYAAALAQGHRISPERRARVVATLESVTGVAAKYWDLADLRVSIHRFIKELRRDERVTVGRLDSRFTGVDGDHVADAVEEDPSYSAILGPYTAAMNHYLRADLGWEDDRRYEILSGEVNAGWNWSSAAKSSYVNVADDLSEAMRRNPHLRVFVANGYYDLATPFHATEYTLDRLQIPGAAHTRITSKYYEAGHMMYVHPGSLVALRDDLVSFYGAAAPAKKTKTSGATKGKPDGGRGKGRGAKQE